MNRIEKALKAASDTKALCIGSGVLCQVGDLFKQQFPNKKAVVIADTNTYSAAGKRVVEHFKSAGVTQDTPYIYNAKGLYAEYGYVDKLVDFLKQTDAIPVAVGSGTINDLAKLASHLTERRYMNVGT